jgi:hypothetical protein
VLVLVLVLVLVRPRVLLSSSTSVRPETNALSQAPGSLPPA